MVQKHTGRQYTVAATTAGHLWHFDCGRMAELTSMTARP